MKTAMETKQETREAGTVETAGTRGTANRKANRKETAVKGRKTDSKTAGTKPGKKPGRKPGTKPAAKPDKAGSVITGNQSGSVDNAGSVPARKRGRPKGSKNKSKNKRPDFDVLTEPGENTKYLTHDLKLMHFPAIDINNPEQVKQRIDDYISLCAVDDMKPSIASLALSFGMSRYVLFDTLNGRNNRIQNIESLRTLKTAYDIINSYYEHLMNNGKINPVAGIFMMKNNLGYRDQTDYTITANNEQQLSLNDITNRANLLDE